MAPGADRERSAPLVFGTGLSRTGTRSAYVELRRLGFDAVHYPYDAATERELFSGAPLSILGTSDAVLDLPAAGFYRQLDELYPGSRFLHTTRERSEWLGAVERHYDSLLAGWPSRPRRFQEFGERITRHVYGAFPFDRDAFAAAYDRHEEGIAAHFADRPGDLLRLDLTRDADSGRIARFLDLPHADPQRCAHITDADELPDDESERTRLRESVLL